MPVAFRRLYGWSGTEWVEVAVDDDGNIKTSPDSEFEKAGMTMMRVSDMSSTELLGQIVAELKIMNTHLQILTDEEIEEIL